MSSTNTYIDAGRQDMSRPKERPPKKTWKTRLLKIYLKVYQYFSPEAVAKIIWKYFTTPIHPSYTPNQEKIIKEAEISTIHYKGFRLNHYSWGSGKRKVLLSHGWNSKIADFRRMITSLVEEGYTVEGIDMKAHGKSEGKSSALPEFRDVLKHHLKDVKKYHAIIGYSLGGIAVAIAIHELPDKLHPENLFLIATPPNASFFINKIVKEDAGCNQQVYNEMIRINEKYYDETIDYLDLRTKTDTLSSINTHLIYDEDDKTIPFKWSLELKESTPSAHWVHTKGLGHYKVIAYKTVIEYIITNLKKQELVENH